jgi:hypothetical protein
MPWCGRGAARCAGAQARTGAAIGRDGARPARPIGAGRAGSGHSCWTAGARRGGSESCRSRASCRCLPAVEYSIAGNAWLGLCSAWRGYADSADSYRSLPAVLAFTASIRSGYARRSIGGGRALDAGAARSPAWVRSSSVCSARIQPWTATSVRFRRCSSSTAHWSRPLWPCRAWPRAQFRRLQAANPCGPWRQTDCRFQHKLLSWHGMSWHTAPLEWQSGQSAGLTQQMAQSAIVQATGGAECAGACRRVRSAARSCAAPCVYGRIGMLCRRAMSSMRSWMCGSANGHCSRGSWVRSA